MYSRHLTAILRRHTRSVLLLGPRQVGKSTLMRELRPDLEINLAHEPTFLAGGASEAAWMSNNELAYMNNETDSLTVARLEFGATTKVTRTPLFDARNYVQGGQGLRNFDVSRDGKSFILLKRLVGKQAAEPIVVLNWAEEVKRLMAAAGIK